MHLHAPIGLAIALSPFVAFGNDPEPVQIAKLPDPTPAGFSELSFFASPVSIGDAFFVVGDAGDNEYGDEAGEVCVFSRHIGHTGLAPVVIHQAEPGPFLSFGRDLSACGDRIAVLGDKTYVIRYDNDSDTWIEEATLPHYAVSVSLGPRQLAIGVFDSVVVYRLDMGPDEADRTDDEWIADAWIPATAPGEFFGHPVVLDGDRLVIGASSSSTRRAYVFERAPDGNWVQTGKFEPASTTEVYFGYSMAMRGDLILVGSPLLPEKGAAYAYRRDSGAGSWQLEARLDGIVDEYFGYSVAISEESLFVGAPSTKSGSLTPGAVYEFRLEGSRHDPMGGWLPINKFSASGGHLLGIAMACRGRTLLVGAGGNAFLYLVR